MKTKTKYIYKQIKLNLHADEYENIEAVAKKYDLTMAGYVRLKMGFDELMETKKVKAIAKVDPDLLFQINKIGNNLNQLARKSNTHNNTDKLILITLLDIKNQLQNILENSKC